MPQFGFSRKVPATILAILLCLTGIIFFVYDLLFTHPTIHKGIIVEKLYVQAKNVQSPNGLTYSNKYKTYKYNLTVKNTEQWLALVRSDDGDTLKVTCQPDHYAMKEVGDTLLFKAYRGKIFKVEYFSHNDEDVDAGDLMRNHMK